MTSRATTKCTPSPESRAGRSRSTSPDGKARAGQSPAPASRSALPDSALDQTTLDISGLHGSSSSASAALTRSLASRCRELLATGGSTLYRMIWKEKATPSGRSYWVLAASGRRTSGNGCGGWPSPTSQDTRQYSEDALRQFAAQGSVGGHHLDLNAASGLSGWPTPTERADKVQRTVDGALAEMERKGANNSLGTAASLSGWPTPRTPTGGPVPEGATGRKLETLAGWATPTSRDHKDGTFNPDGPVPVNSLLGREVSLSPAPTEKRSQLNPAFVRWLMGFPDGWLD